MYDMKVKGLKIDKAYFRSTCSILEKGILFIHLYYLYIVVCQRGGVSNKPTLGSGQRQDTGPGIL